MIIEPVLDKPICLKREVEMPKKITESFEKRNEFILSKPKNKVGVKLNVYFLSVMIFVLGIIFGSIIFRIMIADVSVQELIMQQFTTEGHTEKEVFLNSFTQNIKLLITYWIVGISVVGAPLVLILCMYKGVAIAFVISTFLVKYGFIDGNIYIFKNIFLHYLFSTLGIIILTASSLKVTLNIFKEKKDIRYEVIRHSIFILLGLCLFFTSSIIESKMI